MDFPTTHCAQLSLCASLHHLVAGSCQCCSLLFPPRPFFSNNRTKPPLWVGPLLDSSFSFQTTKRKLYCTVSVGLNRFCGQLFFFCPFLRKDIFSIKWYFLRQMCKSCEEFFKFAHSLGLKENMKLVSGCSILDL